MVAVYLTECAVLVPPGTVGFAAPWLRGWKLAAPWNLFAGLGKAVAMGNPVPPLGRVLACRPPAGGDLPLFRPDEAKRRLEALAGATGHLRIACNAAFVVLFVGAPVAYRTWGLVLTWPYLLAALYAAMFAAAWLYVRASRALYPQGEPDRGMHVVLGALIPTSAMRLCDLLAPRLLDGIHPLAVAAAVCAKDDFTAYARLFRYDMNRNTAGAPAGEPGTAAWFRPEWRDGIERFLAESGAGPDVLDRPPERTEQGSKTYCPRCHATFTIEPGTCRDCGGVPLVPFPAPPPSSV